MVRVLRIRRCPIFCVLLLWVIFDPCATKFSQGGLTVRPFESIEGILEVECNAQKLDFSGDILTISLFAQTIDDNGLVAFVSPNTKECTTKREFSSCVIDQGNSRNTRLKTLVLDLGLGESRMMSCNLTVLDPQKTLISTSWSLLVVRNPMEVHPFQGTLNVQEVVCSGDFLSQETEVMMMSLYTESDQKEVAFVNIPERQCLTYGGFSSCVIDKNRTRKTKLKALVTDIPVGGSRKYGCRLTVVRSRREVDIVSKSVVARRHSMKTSDFLDAHNLLEVSCSGENLPSSIDLLSMSLYETLSYGRQRTRMLASVNFGAKKCLTNTSFSSCTIDEGNSRRTQLRSIVVDLERTGRDWRHYGCNVTGFQSGGNTPVFTWSIAARAKRKLSQITGRA